MKEKKEGPSSRNNKTVQKSGGLKRTFFEKNTVSISNAVKKTTDSRFILTSQISYLTNSSILKAQ